VKALPVIIALSARLCSSVSNGVVVSSKAASSASYLALISSPILLILFSSFVSSTL
jgi:hypothetical protein